MPPQMPMAYQHMGGGSGMYSPGPGAVAYQYPPSAPYLSPKIRTKCPDWPHCELGEEACQYVHPSKPCSYFPSCPHMDRCFYLHPEIKCKFGIRCFNHMCNFIHPEGWNPPKPRSVLTPSGSAVLYPNRTLLCSTSSTTETDTTQQADQCRINEMSDTLPSTPPEMRQAVADVPSAAF
eukprot:GHVO01049716.1.p1 GENE.GHVO01049716.1~~GHVO01049716.1.p1  ORF type:complete len:178 (+),score=18.96 GHVO01049716.1:71-604(+)